MEDRVRLAHYLNEETGAEYVALLEPGERVTEYQESGYEVFGVFYLDPLSREDQASSLPTGRTFVEG